MIIKCKHCNGTGNMETTDEKPEYCIMCKYIGKKRYCKMGILMNANKKSCSFKKVTTDN